MSSSMDTWSGKSTNSLMRLAISDPPRPSGRSIPSARIAAQSRCEHLSPAKLPLRESCRQRRVREMADASDLNLSAGSLRLSLSPSVGGSISAFEWIDGESRRPILRECHSPLRNVLEACSFPLVPYVNRIRGGRFTFRGQEMALAPNMPGDPSPLHGQGWLNPWSVEEAIEAEARLYFRHAAGEWPWD